jgi:hypothetical protein
MFLDRLTTSLPPVSDDIKGRSKEVCVCLEDGSYHSASLDYASHGWTFTSTQEEVTMSVFSWALWPDLHYDHPSIKKALSVV